MVSFGTNGIRGRFDELNPQFTLKLSRAIGKYFGGKRKKIGVGRDARLTGECLEYSVISGLTSVGCDVMNFGIVSSPTAEFMIKKLKLDGLIIITASHNPPEWNALKVVDSRGVSLSKKRGLEIEKLIGKVESCDWKDVGKVIYYNDAVSNHIDSICSFVNVEKIKKRNPKVVIDCGNGATGNIAPILFHKLGCEVISMNEKLDGHFPNRPSEPKEANVKELIKKVVEERADCGVAWDGDGDRVIFVDENGRYIIGDEVFGLSILFELSEFEKSYEYIATTVATSKLVEDLAIKFGKKVYYTEVGAPALSEAIADGKAGFGGEEVGGVIWPAFSLAKDGLFTAAKMVEALTDKKLSEWCSQIPKYYLKKMSLKIENKEDAIEKINKLKEYSKSKNWNTITVDGVRINEKEGWAIARASGTEPLIRIFAEGKTEQYAKELIEKIKKIILM